MKKLKPINKKNVSKKQQELREGISQETWDFIEESNEFLKKNNIKPKEFTYQSGLEFGSYLSQK